METVLELIGPLIEAYGGKFGFIIQVISICGSLHLSIAPLMEGLKKITKATYWTSKDDEFVIKLEQSSIYKTVRLLVGWLAGIKLPKKR